MQGMPVERATRKAWYQDRVLIPLIAIVFALDQATKILIRHSLYLGESIPSEAIFRITNTYNTGSAFGLFRDQTIPLIIASFIGITILILLYKHSDKPNRTLRISLGLQLGGAAGNLIDRITMGYVTDFIALGFWPVFNVADSCIVIGLIILAWLFTFSKRRPPVTIPIESLDITHSNPTEDAFRSTEYEPTGQQIPTYAEEKAPATTSIIVGTPADRLDAFLASELSPMSRSRINQLIKQGHILVNTLWARPSQKIKVGDHISIQVPPPTPTNIVPQDIPITVFYRDDDLLVVDKPSGLTVHPGPGHPVGTLVNALLAMEPCLPGIGGSIRPGIVHRLDKDTSGLMIVAKSESAHKELSRQLKYREVNKGYQALVKGKVEPAEDTIISRIGRDSRHRKRMAIVMDGKESETSYRVLQYLKDHTLLEVFPKTGRTHQIRVHFSSQGHPLLGDSLYGGRSSLSHRHFLHAHLLGFHHPTTGEYLEFTSPLPADLLSTLEQLTKNVHPVT